MPQNVSTSVEDKLVDLVLDANETILPQQVCNGDNPIDYENDQVLKSAIQAFNQGETDRSKRKKPLLWALIILTAFQVIVFNVIIAGTGWFLFRLNDVSVLPLFFDILKYYIGATLVELIGILTFIIKGTFTSDHTKLMETLLNRDKHK